MPDPSGDDSPGSGETSTAVSQTAFESAHLSPPRDSCFTFNHCSPNLTTPIMAAPVDAKLLRKTKFPPEFSRKVDMQKVNIEVMKKFVHPSPDFDREDPMLITVLNCRWIAGRISEILGNEDDVVIELCFGLIEGTRYVCYLQCPLVIAGTLLTVPVYQLA